MKTMVIYYSRTGFTKAVAEKLKEKLHADLIEITDMKNRKGIIGWLCSGRDALRKKTTEIKPESVIFSGYDRIYIGTPVWAANPAPAITTLVKQSDLSGREIRLFATYGGTGIKNALKNLSKLVEEKGSRVTITQGFKTGGIKIESYNPELPDNFINTHG